MVNFMNVALRFGQGLDTKTDRKQVIPGKLLTLENGVFLNTGAINKRYGYDVLSVAIDGGDAITSGAALSTFGNELLLYTGNRVYSRLSASKKWADRGKVVSLILDGKPVVSNTWEQMNPDVAYNSGWEVYAWEDGRGGIRYSVVDNKTSAYLDSDAFLILNGSKPKLVAFNGYTLCLYVDGGSIKYRAINMAEPSVLSAEEVITANLDSDRKIYDTCVVSDEKLVLTFGHTDGYSTLVSLDPSLNVSSEVNTTVFEPPLCTTVFSDAQQNIWVGYHDGVDIRAYCKTYLFTDLLAPTTVDSYSGNVTSITGLEVSEGVAQFFYEVPNEVRINYLIRSGTITRSGTAGGASVFKRSVGLASKAFKHGDEVYLVASYDSTLQATYYVLDSSGDELAKILPWASGGHRDNGTLANVCEAASSGAFIFAGMKKTRLISEDVSQDPNNGLIRRINKSGGFSVNAVHSISLDFSSPNKFFGTTLAGNHYTVGGILQSYDGISFTEANFNVYPDSAGIFLEGTGGIYAGTGYRENAVPVDEGGGGGSEPTEDDTPPVGFITYPVDEEETYSGTIVVTASASDNVAVDHVDLYVDGVFHSSDSSAPYTFNLDTHDLSDGSHELKVRSWDIAGNDSYSAGINIDVENTTPILEFTRQIRGVNVAGGEMAWGSYTLGSPVSNTNYLWASNQDFNYIAGKGFNFVRFIITWEEFQPVLNGSLASNTYTNTFWDRLDYATNTCGLYVLVEIHGASSGNFARYKGNAIGSGTSVTNAHFADFWSRMAGDTRMKDNPKTMIGLMNEPNSMGTKQWWDAAQAACDAIRDAGYTNLVMIEGNGYSAASTWTNNWYDTSGLGHSNASRALLFTDKLATINPTNYPNGNYCFQVHTYFDADQSGTYTTVTSTSAGVSQVANTLNWCVANNKRFFLGEFGARAGVTNASACVSNLLAYLDSNRDVCLGWAWWGYGPPSWWGGYKFTMCPTSSYTVDSPQYALVSAYLPAP